MDIMGEPIRGQAPEFRTVVITDVIPQWLFRQEGTEWAIQSFFSAEYDGLDAFRPQKKEYPNGTKVINSQQTLKWHISKGNDAELSRDPHAPAKFRYANRLCPLRQLM